MSSWADITEEEEEKQTVESKPEKKKGKKSVQWKDNRDHVGLKNMFDALSLTHCEGCLCDSGSQRDHMGLGGCLN